MLLHPIYWRPDFANYSRHHPAADCPRQQELGVEIEVDGAFGPQSEAALNAFAAQEGVSIPSDPVERITALAKLVWERSAFRVDLY